jgi:hypothetical protein
MQPNYAEAAPVYAAEKPAWVDQQIETAKQAFEADDGA